MVSSNLKLGDYGTITLSQECSLPQTSNALQYTVNQQAVEA